MIIILVFGKLRTQLRNCLGLITNFTAATGVIEGLRVRVG